MSTLRTSPRTSCGWACGRGSGGRRRTGGAAKEAAEADFTDLSKSAAAAADDDGVAAAVEQQQRGQRNVKAILGTDSDFMPAAAARACSTFSLTRWKRRRLRSPATAAQSPQLLHPNMTAPHSDEIAKEQFILQVRVGKILFFAP